jgi:G3E family GTPase
MDTSDRIPVNLLTGFLGSGKTTLLNRLLRGSSGSEIAVLVNELGEVGLDHELLARIDDATVVLEGGCLCCTIRDDLAAAMRDLYRRRERGEVPAFTRLVIETTGLADPAPVIRTLATEPVLCHRFRLSNVIATVDALHGSSELTRHSECVRQIAVADRLIITKDDLRDTEALAALELRLKQLNPTAAVARANRDDLDARALLASDAFDPASKAEEVRRWLADEATHSATHAHRNLGATRHGRDYAAICLVLDDPLDWSAFGIWLTMLLHRYGAQVLRVKGLLNVSGLRAPVLVQCVQHTIHPPEHLDAWPSGDRRSRLVVIVESLARETLLRSLGAFNGLTSASSAATSVSTA